jgi:hypothetical protein
VGRALATAVTALFVAAGWLAGALWFRLGLRHCALSVQYGFRAAAPAPPLPSGERAAPPRPRPGPAGTLIEN